MRPATLASTLLTSGLVLTTNAQLVPFFFDSKPTDRPNQRVDNKQQHPMDNTLGIQLPPSNTNNDDNDNDKDRNRGDVILSDVIGTARQINIFASFCRDVSPISTRLDTSTQNTTVLAPRNSAISALPLKPWEDPADYAALGTAAYDGKDGEDRAHRNLRRFTEAHVVPVSPWGEGERVKSLGGREVWWERDGEGKAVVMPVGVGVEAVVQRVANGEVWVWRMC